MWRQLLITLSLALTAGPPASAQPFDGFNIIATPGHPFGSVSARRSLAAARDLGATTVAIVPFLWQAHAQDSEISRGEDMSDAALATAIRDAHALGFKVLVKPHVWVPGSWAGAVAPGSAKGWKVWFGRYSAALTRLAAVAAEEKADAFAIGTELAKTSHRREWIELIAAARTAFAGTLFYFAHNPEEAEAIDFWPLLDAVGVTLYPPLGADDDRPGRLAVMERVAQRLDALAARHGKPVVVGEIGIRSAHGAAAKPWESAEERAAAPDPQLQAQVLADWLSVLKRPSVSGVLVWRWFTDPGAGGPQDTDFTVQQKPAEGVLRCAWTARCR